MIKVQKLKKIKPTNDIVTPEIREDVKNVIITTAPIFKTEVVVPVPVPILKENIVIPEEPLPNAIDENNLDEVDYDNPLEEDTEVESTNEVIAEGVINKRPSRGKKGLVETIDVIAQEVKILEQLLKDSNKRMSTLKKALLEFRRELRASKIKG